MTVCLQRRKTHALSRIYPGAAHRSRNVKWIYLVAAGQGLNSVGERTPP